MSLLNKKHMQWAVALKTMTQKKYWTKANLVEFIAFVIKALIIIPGLLFDISIWWFYILALLSSFGLVWSSTIKTIPTLIWFNILWSLLSVVYIFRYWGIL